MKLRGLLCVTLMLTLNFLNAQQRTTAGKVTDEKGKPPAKATVKVKGTASAVGLINLLTK